MKSPFPGMDPYLEQYWRDVHHGLVTYARDQLQTRLPGQLRARMEERVFVETEQGEHRVVYPDVHVVEHPQAKAQGGTAETGVAVDEPLVLHLNDEPATQGYLEIIEVGSGNRVVTVIEFLSPSNKMPGQGQDVYVRKQEEVIAAGASLVEIDLVRAGRRTFSVPAERIPPSHRTTYQAVARRGWQPSEAEVYRMPLDRPLPAIRIPLRQTDTDVAMDVQSLVDQCYSNGRYDDLDYQVEPRPPLDPPDAAWAAELLKTKGLRT